MKHISLRHQKILTSILDYLLETKLSKYVLLAFFAPSLQIPVFVSNGHSLLGMEGQGERRSKRRVGLFLTFVYYSAVL